MGLLRERQIVVYRHKFRQRQLVGVSEATQLLQASGFRVRELLDGPLEAGRDDVVWIRGNAGYCPRVCRELISLPRSDRPFVFCRQSEPLPPSRASGFPWPWPDAREIYRILRPGVQPADIFSNYFALRRLARNGLPDILVAATRSWQEFLLERGIPAEWVPGAAYAHYGRDLGLARDVDVLFLGDLKVRRRRRALAGLRKAGVELTAVGDMHNPAYWGEPRVQLLNRVKILLNLHRAPSELPSVRLLLGIVNGALVISEPIYRPEPFVPGVHYVSATQEEMPDAIRYYLTHADERERIMAQGRRLATEELRPESIYARITGMIDRRLAER